MCDIDGQPSCMTERVRTARKSHRCCECSVPILAGEKYHFMSGVWDGRGESFKSHIRCNELRQWMHEEHEKREREYARAWRAFEVLADVASMREKDAATRAVVPCGPCMRGLEASIAEWADEGFDVCAMFNDATRRTVTEVSDGNNSTERVRTELAHEAEEIHGDGGDSARSF